MRVAIVHDYLNQLGWAERVVGVLHEMFPDAPIYTLLVERDKLWPSLQDAVIIPSALQRFGFVRRHFKLFFWLFPFAIRTLDVRDFDLVISSSSAYGKGVRLPRGDGRPVHVCYCYTPMRFAWNFDEYIRHEKGPRWMKSVARLFVPPLRLWDVATARGVDQFIAISHAVQDRIQSCYNRDAVIVYPPVDDAAAEVAASGMDASPCDEPYFLVVSRLVSYKRLDLAVRACAAMGARLFVIGSGPDRDRLEALAGLAGSTVTFLGWQPEDAVHGYMRHCRALIFPGVEDFGITPVEVNLLGQPVVAFAAGGALDTIVPGVNGLFFYEPTVDALVSVLRDALEREWDSDSVRRVGLSFVKEVFVERLRSVIEIAVARETTGSSGEKIRRGERLV